MAGVDSPRFVWDWLWEVFCFSALCNSIIAAHSPVGQYANLPSLVLKG